MVAWRVVRMPNVRNVLPMVTAGQLADDEPVENYLASVSDLMSGLIVFFILTLLVVAMTFTQATGELTSAMEVRDEILTQVQSILAQDGVRVQIDPDQGILRLPEAILFPTGSADLRPEGERALRSLARALARVLPCYALPPGASLPSGCLDRPYRGQLDAVFIEGHTDNVPIRNLTFADNWELSTARAMRTYQALVAVEPSLDSLHNYAGQPLFSVSGYADRRPVASNDSEAGRQMNRRIDIRLVMATPSLPEVLSRELSQAWPDVGGRESSAHER